MSFIVPVSLVMKSQRFFPLEVDGIHGFAGLFRMSDHSFEFTFDTSDFGGSRSGVVSESVVKN